MQMAMIVLTPIVTGYTACRSIVSDVFKAHKLYGMSMSVSALTLIATGYSFHRSTASESTYNPP